MKNIQCAVGYVRVSSLDQVKDNESLPRQEQKIRQYCAVKGYSEVKIIRDEGVSGFKDAREGFKEVMRLCSSGAVHSFIINDLSRLSRSVRTTLSFVEDIVVANKINFVSLSQDIETHTPHGKAFLTLISVFNQLYRDEIAFKTRAAIRHKKMQNRRYSNRLPFGYDADENDNLVASNADNTILQVILSLRANGSSYRQIAQELKNQRCKTKTGNANWQPRFIKKILDRSVSDGC